MSKIIEDLTELEKWLEGLGISWNLFGDIDRGKQLVKNAKNQAKKDLIADVVGQSEQFYCHEGDDLEHDRCKVPCHFCERV